jgi:hypothetical protein
MEKINKELLDQLTGSDNFFVIVITINKPVYITIEEIKEKILDASMDGESISSAKIRDEFDFKNKICISAEANKKHILNITMLPFVSTIRGGSRCK